MWHRGLQHKWNIFSGCTGLGAEFWVCTAVGIPVANTAVGCDPCEAVRSVLLENSHHAFAHFYNDFRDMIAMKGRCYRCGTICDSAAGYICPVRKAVFPDQRQDLAVLGPPCQPFSMLSASNKASGASQHPLFYVLFPDNFKVVGLSGGASVVDFLAVHLPVTVIIEEVASFGDVDKTDGKCWLREMIKLIKGLLCPFSGELWYTGIDVFNDEPGKWMNVRRPRFWEYIGVTCIRNSTLRLTPARLIVQTALEKWMSHQMEPPLQVAPSDSFSISFPLMVVPHSGFPCCWRPGRWAIFEKDRPGALA